MSTASKTYQELLQLANTMNMVLGNEEYTKNNTKAVKKLQKIGEKLKGHLEKYNEKLENVRLDNANTDESGSLILNEKGEYKFSKDGFRQLNADVKALLAQTFEFEQFEFSQEGLENFLFLDGWVKGLTFTFPKAEEAEFVEMEAV